MRALIVVLLALWGCGNPALDGPCQATCDCSLTSAPLKCVGEWVCNANKTCEYQCKNTCEAGTVFTCRAEEECNGSFCSERKACH
jgi:hypothetical protein